MHIRAAEPTDIPHMAKLNSQVQALHVHLEPTRYRPVTDVKEIEASLTDRLNHPDRGALVAVEGDTLIGLAVWEVRRREATTLTTATHTLHIDQLAVAETHQKRGAGRALMEACEAKARGLGCQRVNLYCRWSNVEARGFYDALGYRASQVTLERSLEDDAQ